MTSITISFRADEQTSMELKTLAGGRSYSEAIRQAIHDQYVAGLYAEAAADAERLRNDPDDIAEIETIAEELGEISAW
jgi:hypothetical protein